jgi:DNA-directed RNA polymerase specialized sigma24 family protein
MNGAALLNLSTADRAMAADHDVVSAAQTGSPDAFRKLHADQRQFKTLRAIRGLDPRLRALIRMQLMHGWSLREISRALNISEAAVKAHLYRARQRLSTAHHLNRSARQIKKERKTDRGTDATVSRAPGRQRIEWRA